MPNVETRCEEEEYLVELLEQRGWTVHDSTRRGVDLDLEVELDGHRGKVLFRNSFDAPKGTVAPSPDPSFIRIDIGTPSGEPERWALWDRYDFPTGKDTPSYVATVFHEAMGASWASVAGNAVTSGESKWQEGWRTFQLLVNQAEALSPARDATARSNHLFHLVRRNFGVQRRKLGVTLFIMLFVMLGVGPFLYVWGQSGAWAALESAPILVGFFLLILAIFGLVALIRRARQPRGPVEGMEAVAENLRATGAFEVVELTRAKKRDGLPVVHRIGGFLSWGSAPLFVSRLAASSPSHAVTVEADLCRVHWPDQTIEECRFLPDRWLTIELAGPEADLVKLPTGVREDRRQGTVRWLLTGEDLDAGRAEDLFQSLNVALTAQSGPYR